MIDPAGITGLSLESFKDNWSSDYQFTNDAGIPDPEGKTYWNFKSSNSDVSTSALATYSHHSLAIPAIVYIGIILSTLGAALQSLTGAPRLLAAIANDDILPVLNYFKVADGYEPYIATLFTAFICIGCVIIGNLDLITPTITMFFLLCYAGVNLSCFLLDLLDAPSWRPRWNFHHWSFSLLGASLCIVIMFLISWSFTVVSLALASLIYYYVSIKGKAGDWGDGFKSAYFQLALRSLRSLGANQVHPKNWIHPTHILPAMGKLPENVPCHPKLADFANCMKKKGPGMSIFVSILEEITMNMLKMPKQRASNLIPTLITRIVKAEVIVISMKSWDAQAEGGSQQDESLEAFTAAQQRIASYLTEMKSRAEGEGNVLLADGKPVVVNEQQVEKFLFTTLKLNLTILRYSRMAAVVLVSLPPPPINHPAYFYMEYMDLLVENVPRLLMVRGYRRDVVTLFT
ncbi:hypothetical protein GH714_041201 [Hevea brasiliensis]|uniref:Amino acid permease/ SLC12A domain-containing protein n=1 Tax=Hevea brasiliensis TaxID=3981 RepID=A0A6A6MVR5_HEVBR|nr:hypothetical protein GH714_041201 [Hevea brasiliensis]